MVPGAIEIPPEAGRRMSRPEICYRCGQDARVQFAGFPYCGVCVFVVEAMLPAVKHDPPPGFPNGGAGAPNWNQRMMDRLGSDFKKQLEEKK